ncbi:hypothetical protein [Bacillus sp. T33-2]|uniref:hypothetical protein n=1 Tax=Bacillus sp. T33-2 TaxID=2054168 RepID=UPI000C775936|nr:hypothetical protein [Bacillus sp. T33-2]PLR95734.1 hypothetical protein CVD19_13425 [Bacillus sp. T33-2]
MKNARKIYVAFFTAVIFTFGFFLIFLRNMFITLSFNDFSSFIIVFIYSLVGNVLYGLPVSLLADFVSQKFKKIRILVSGLIHIGLGSITYFIFPHFFAYFIMMCSIIFFVLDEITRRKSKSETQ